MKRIAAAAVAVLFIAGCTSAPERDEGAYLEHMRATGGDGVSIFEDAELIDSGDAMCARALDEGISMDEAFDNMARYAVEEQNADADTLNYLSALFDGSAEYLCPEQE